MESVKKIVQVIESNDIHGAYELFRKNRDEEFKFNCWELIPPIVEFSKNRAEGETYEVCKELVKAIAKASSPEDTFLQLIEIIEECNDLRTLLTIQEASLEVFPRLVTNLNLFAWLFKSIQSFWDKRDNDVTINYQIETFFPYFVRRGIDDKNYKLMISQHLINFLWKPTSGLNDQQSERAILDLFFTLNGDPVKFCIQRVFKPNQSALAHLFYLVFHDKLNIERIPKVYSNEYVVSNAVTLVNELLEIDAARGCGLMSALLESRPRFPALVLELPEQRTFCVNLERAIVYSEDKSTRQAAFEIYKSYIDCFDDRGKYHLFTNLLGTFAHSGLIGFTVVKFKEAVIESEYFRGEKLYDFVRKCFDVSGNVVQCSDKIISVLNLIRFVLIRNGDDSFRNEVDGYIRRLKGIVKDNRDACKMMRNEREIYDKLSVNVLNGDDDVKSDKQSVDLSITVLDLVDSLIGRIEELLEG